MENGYYIMIKPIEGFPANIEWETILNCPMCGKKVIECDYIFALDDRSLDIEMRYMKCPVCMLYFRPKRMTEDYLKFYYEKVYRKLLFGDNPINEEDLAIQKIRTIPTMGLIQKCIQQDILPKTGRLLEIGSSGGELLQAAQDELEWQAMGIDIDPIYREYANKRGRVTYDKVEGNYSGRMFDVIAMLHVLEHTNYPIDFIRTYTQYLSPNGVLVIDVPHAERTLASYSIHHPIAFTEESLKWMFNELRMPPLGTVFYGIRSPLKHYLIMLARKE